MERIKLVLRLIGILCFPIIIGFLSAILWQNNNILIDKFSLLGSWWELENLGLSSLLISFLLIGSALALGVVSIFINERKLYHKLAELKSYQQKKNKQEQLERKAMKDQSKPQDSQPNIEAGENKTLQENESTVNLSE